MLKIPENKPRKRLRLALCVLYLLEMVMCAWPFLRNPEDGGQVTVFTVISSFFDSLGQDLSATEYTATRMFAPFFFIFFLVPVVGFFFCALDKERNMKNIVSLICCLVGVVTILCVVTPASLDVGSLFALLLYILICFLSSVSMMARIADNPKKENKN